ncbi:MAG: response regulator, partial [Planctomycetes bacterium]|nr:response regulator [Planctomycetota bacterium]
MAENAGIPAAGEERLRALLEVVPLALFEAGPGGSWTWGNARFRELAGASPGEDLAAALTRRAPADRREAAAAAWRDALRSGEPFSLELPLGDPPSATVRARGVPIPGPGGAPRGWAGVLEDVTEQRRREALLLEEAERARDRSRHKSEFLAVMSHEIRTPLHGVVGTASLLQSTPLSPEQREYVDILVHSADATLSVVDNVLDLSKIEAGRLELDEAPFDLREAVEKSAALFAARAHAKGLEFACTVEEGLPASVVGDGDRLRQVLANLVGNAVKFTEKGEVVLSVSRVDPPGPGPELLRFEVRDSGIGISEEARRRIFEPFQQADATIAARFGGTGLGLAICRQLVRMMHGVLGAEGRPGAGSSFWFTASFPAPPGGFRPPPPPPEEVRGRRVLLVDDHPATRAAAASLLSAWSVQCGEAGSADEALVALRLAAADYRPWDAVLLDMHLPGDGSSRGLVDALRADPGLSRVKVILATSFGHRARAEAQKWEGVAAFLPKPIRRSDLAACLGAVFGEEAGDGGGPFGRAPSPRMPAVSATGSFRVARILVVDDNEVNRRIAVRQLERKGYLVETASDGAEAVEAVKRTPYDLVFMDWVMPGMDGFEATRAIRAWEEGRGTRTPIVAMTACAMEGDRERCLEPGMDDYLTKPVRFEDLDAMLDRWLAQGPLPPGDSPPPARAPGAAPPPPASAPAPAP